MTNRGASQYKRAFYVRRGELAFFSFFAVAFASIAHAATYCPPKGSGAPGYCENIPHKGKEKRGKKKAGPARTKASPSPTPSPPRPPQR
jgi:hypothetical protein